MPANYPIKKKKILLYFLHFIMFEKDAFLVRYSKLNKENKIKLLKPIQVLTGW